MNEMTPLDVELPLGETTHASLRRQLRWWRDAAALHRNVNAELRRENRQLQKVHAELSKDDRAMLQSILDDITWALRRAQKTTMKRDVAAALKRFAQLYKLRYKGPAE